MIVPKQGYKRQYAFGGTGIFDSIGNIIKGIVTSKAGKDLAKFALDSAKNITKTTASDIGNRLVKKVLTPKSKSIISKHTKALNPTDAVKINNLVNFTRVNNEEYNTVSINIENAIIEIEKEDYQIMDMSKTKFGYKKANIKINNEDFINKLKSWETEINDYLKSEVGTGPITILYSNRIYPKVSFMIGQEKEERHIKINGVWINEQNKPFVQLYYVHHS